MDAESFLKNMHYLTGMLLIVLSVASADGESGACYGTLGNNLPPPSEIIALCNQHKIRRLRLYNPNPSILQALNAQSTNISLMVGVPNEDIQGIAANPSLAASWVRTNILTYRNVNFRYIAVGNEISPSGPAVAPAMQNIYNALASFKLTSKVKVSTSLSMEFLAKSYPPSKGVFVSDTFINPIVRFLVTTSAPFLLNVYPYLAYTSNTKDIRLACALSTARSTVVRDGKYQYRSLFDAMVDSVHAALEKAGGGSVKVVVSDTGWPTEGGAATSVENAKAYVTNVLTSVKRGTPRRAGKALETYI